MESFHTYRHPLEAVAAHPETPSAVVDYRELVTDPAAAVERIYRDLELPLDTSYREKLEGMAGRARSHVTNHRYSLEEFGLEGSVIRDELGDLFERFGWDVEPARPDPIEEQTT